jgi:putative ABC transport system permease protein
MNGLRTFAHRLRGIFQRARRDAELSAELRAHLDELTDENVRRGMTAQEARHAALREFGGIEQTKEAYREQRAFPFVDAIAQDLHFGLRMLTKTPSFTFAAILTLALGIGANTAIFSAVNGILLKPLPYAKPEKLVEIRGFQKFAGEVEAQTSFSQSTWKQIREHTPAIEQMGLYNTQDGTITGDEVPENISYAAVSGSFFSTLGVPPLLGRPILPADEESNQKDIVVVSYLLWKERMNGDPKVLSRKIVLDGRPYQIIGVMPPGFVFASDKKGAWIPLAPAPGEEAIGLGVARIRRDVTLKQANAQLKVVGLQVAAKLKTNRNWEAQAVGIKEDELGDVRQSLLILFAAVGCVLLIACVNVSGLLLARGWGRQREIAIRAALGATRFRLVRQFLAESVLLALAGGAVGLIAAAWGIRILHAIAPPDTPRLDEMQLDPTVFWFTVAVSLTAGILFGLVPALQVSAEGPAAALKGAALALPGLQIRRTHRLRSSLVTCEIALAVILVIGASLVVRSFAKITSVKLGFRTDHIITLTTNFAKASCHEHQSCSNSASEILRRIRLLPGVTNADIASTLPIDATSLEFHFHIEGREQDLGLEGGTEISDREVSPHYFDTMGIPIVAGRGFDENDRDGAPRVAIVNQTFARTYFSGNALGHRVSRAGGTDRDAKWYEIVGVVADSHDVEIGHKPIVEYYMPTAQAPFSNSPSFIVRALVDPGAITPAIKNQIWAGEKDVPIPSVRTMDQVIAESVAVPRFRTLLLGAFAALGLLLALVGVYGVISYGVGQRTREIGVRMALGANPKEVLWFVLRQGLLLAGIGVVVGLAGALALTRFLQDQLFEITSTDPLTFAMVAIFFPVVAVLACYVPARRAMRVDPLVALRYE